VARSHEAMLGAPRATVLRQVKSRSGRARTKISQLKSSYSAGSPKTPLTRLAVTIGRIAVPAHQAACAA